MNLAAIFPKKKTNWRKESINYQQYPYLLKDLIIIKVNQVWVTDISVPCQAA